jgi:hypothetical protein
MDSKRQEFLDAVALIYTYVGIFSILSGGLAIITWSVPLGFLCVFGMIVARDLVVAHSNIEKYLGSFRSTINAFRSEEAAVDEFLRIATKRTWILDTLRIVMKK